MHRIETELKESNFFTFNFKNSHTYIIIIKLLMVIIRIHNISLLKNVLKYLGTRTFVLENNTLFWKMYVFKFLNIRMFILENNNSSTILSFRKIHLNIQVENNNNSSVFPFSQKIIQILTPENKDFNFSTIRNKYLDRLFSKWCKSIF